MKNMALYVRECQVNTIKNSPGNDYAHLHPPPPPSPHLRACVSGDLELDVFLSQVLHVAEYKEDKNEMKIISELPLFFLP